MEVCESCHESDKHLIKCSLPLGKHVRWYRGFVGKCDICGKTVEVTYACSAYRKYVENTDHVCM